MDLTKAYDCLTDNLLITKLQVYRLDHSSLTFMLDYPKKETTKRGTSHSNQTEIVWELCEGSILLFMPNSRGIVVAGIGW